MNDKKFIIVLVLITVIGFLFFPVSAISRRQSLQDKSRSRLERNVEKKKLREDLQLSSRPKTVAEQEIAKLSEYLSIEMSRNARLKNRIKQLNEYINKLESYITQIEQHLEIVQTPFEPDTGKPQFGEDIRYKPQIPIILFPQVFERDLSKSDYSVSGAMFLGTDTITKENILTIKDVKYCNRTQSWWVEVNAIKPPPFSTGQRQRIEKCSGWFNHDALIEYPLLPILPKRPKKPNGNY